MHVENYLPPHKYNYTVARGSVEKQKISNTNGACRFLTVVSETFQEHRQV